MVTNFFKIRFSFTEFDIQRIDYSEEELKRLREKHNRDCSFFRYENYIYISPQKDANLDLGETVRISIDQNPKIVESLIRHLLFRTFRSTFQNHIPESFSPLRFRSNQKHDPVREKLPLELRANLGLPRLVEVHVRTIQLDNKPQFGLVIYSRHRWRFRLTLAELHNEGFNLKGCTVLESIPIPGLVGVLTPDETLLGIVQNVSNGEASIQTNSGLIKRPLAELFLERSRSQIARYLAFRLGERHAEALFARLRGEELERLVPARFYGELNAAAKWFSEQTYHNDDGFEFTVTNDATLPDTGYALQQTRLIFDYAPGASAPGPLRGLVTYGPYDSSKFDTKSPRLLVIFNEQNRGAVTQLVAKLIEGIPSSAYFKKGFQALFQLHKVETVLKSIDTHSAEEYEKAIDESIQENTGPFHLALVECLDESKSFPDAENPYLRAKARLMGYGIPVQAIRESNVRAAPASLAWTLGPIALQMYAKIGGIPWLLPGSQSVDRELIIGIGHASQRPNNWVGAEQSRIVGLTSFFLGDGQYVLGRALKSVLYENYFDTLLSSLEESLKEISADYGWKDGSVVRIVFHVFKPLKNIEIDVIDKLIRKFPNFNIIYAFLTISTKHPWMMFRSADEQDEKWTVTPCGRGANIVLDDHSCLLQLRGPDDRPNKKQRPPLPVLVRLHEKSSYRDLHFIAQQIMDFSYLSWRSFFPNETPVTTFYSELMARLNGKLQHVEGWNSTVLDRYFRRKTWFL